MNQFRKIAMMGGGQQTPSNSEQTSGADFGDENPALQSKKSFFDKASFALPKPSLSGLAGKAVGMIAGTATTTKDMKQSDFDLSPEDEVIDLDGQGQTNVFNAEFDPNTVEQEQEQLSIAKFESTTSTGASKTSFTTANGDGLTFDPFSLNIFDEIQLIIDDREAEHKAAVKELESKQEEKPEIEPVAPVEEEEYFEMDDVPDHLKPTSILLEIMEQMEELKENLVPLREREKDLSNCIKQLNRGQF